MSLFTLTASSKWQKYIFFPTGRVYSKKQTRVSANQHIFKSGLDQIYLIKLLNKDVIWRSTSTMLSVMGTVLQYFMWEHLCSFSTYFN